MKDFIIPVICTLIAFCIGSAFGFSFGTDTNFEGKILETKLTECRIAAESYNEFKSAVRNITANPYDADYNTCYDSSKKVQKAFAEIGIESSIFINEDRSHAWICPWMEATTGQFIAPGQYTVLEIRDINLEVICNNI